MTCRSGLFLLLAVLSPLHAQTFDREVAPLLARHCLDCHGEAASKGKLNLARKKNAFDGGKSGPALVPGNLKESVLWQRIEADEMPPKKPLLDSEKKVLKRWIEAGAVWGTDPIDPFRFSTEHRAGYDWWSLRPLARADAPRVQNKDWPLNGIDPFVLAQLEARGLTPTPAAERRVLIRRLSFDLLGLPPSPEEVEAFVKDRDPQAYEKLVDRYLASPHYGERWARRWLDIVRFGESDGFERDLPRPNAWPYRDWVIEALNRDMPYDRFVRLQLAGDQLEPDDPSSFHATGFLVAGPHDIVVPVSERMRATMLQDEMEDLIGTVGQTFLGLTVNCARCHDHKFDPISQADYYRLAAALAGVRHGERPVTSSEGQKELARQQAKLSEQQRALHDLEEPVRKQVLAERGKDRSGPKPIAEWDFQKDLNDRIGTLHVTLKGTAKREAKGLVLDGKSGYALTERLPGDLKARTLEAWVRLDTLEQQGGGVLTVQTTDGNVFDSLVYGEKQAGHWIAGSDFFRRTQAVGGAAETEAARRTIHLAVTYHSDGTVALYRDGLPYGKGYPTQGPIEFRAATSQVLFGLRHGPPGGNRLLKGTIERARLYDRALTSEEVAASSGSPISEDELVGRLKAQEKERRQTLQAEVRRLQTLVEQARVRASGKVFTVVPVQPKATHVLRRGSVDSPADEVQAGGLQTLGKSDFKLPKDAPEGQRRVELARWITDLNNPLFARVIVNRLWQYHFGAGLIETTSDFGFNAGKPNHPELLDYLALELQRNKMSLKAMHRLMVTSATYRQGSQPRETGRKLDADNRLMWRYAPQRVDAESLRDAMLAVSGVLDRTVGGKGYEDFRSYFFKGTQFYDPLEQVGPNFRRRTIYRMATRGGRNPFLDTFDCPDPSTPSPRRAMTTTPLQALVLMNNAQVLDLSEQLARRVEREAGKGTAQQIQRLCELAYGRACETEERELMQPFVQEHGLAAPCRVILNSNEFVTID